MNIQDRGTIYPISIMLKGTLDALTYYVIKADGARMNYGHKTWGRAMVVARFAHAVGQRDK